MALIYQYKVKIFLLFIAGIKTAELSCPTIKINKFRFDSDQLVYLDKLSIGRFWFN